MGNTLETRGLTYSYTFYTNPKNALTGCKRYKTSSEQPKNLSAFSIFYALTDRIWLKLVVNGHKRL